MQGSGSAMGASDVAEALVKMAGTDGLPQIGSEKDVAVHANAGALSELPTEKQWNMLSNILTGENGADVLERYPDAIVAVIPELSPCVGFDQHSSWHIYDVYTHLCETVRAVDSESPAVLLGALLHDVGKPKCFSVDKAGEGHFYGHPEASIAIARPILTRLGLPPRDWCTAAVTIRYHDHFMLDKSPQAVEALMQLAESDEDVSLLTPSEAVGLSVMMRAADILGQNPSNRETRLANVENLRVTAIGVLREHGCLDEAVPGLDAPIAAIENGREDTVSKKMEASIGSLMSLMDKGAGLSHDGVEEEAQEGAVEAPEEKESPYADVSYGDME